MVPPVGSVVMATASGYSSTSHTVQTPTDRMKRNFGY